MAVPSAGPPRENQVVSVFPCLLTVDSQTAVALTHPEELSREIRQHLGGHPVDVSGPSSGPKDDPLVETIARSKTLFHVVRDLMEERIPGITFSSWTSVWIDFTSAC